MAISQSIGGSCPRLIPSGGDVLRGRGDDGDPGIPLASGVDPGCGWAGWPRRRGDAYRDGHHRLHDGAVGLLLHEHDRHGSEPIPNPPTAQ